MRSWFTLALALAVTALPAAAQTGMGSPQSPQAAPCPPVTTTMPADMFRQGAFVRHQDGTRQSPETVTLRYTWQGMPLFVTYQVSRDQRWLTAGRPARWDEIREGALVTVPAEARVLDVTFNGSIGAGTVTAINPQQQTVTVRLPSGEMRVLRMAPTYLMRLNGQLVPSGQLAVGETVLFEVPPGSNQVALVSDVGPAVPGTITAVHQRSIQVRFMQNGQEVTRSFGIDSDTRFYQRGRIVAVRDIDREFRQGDQVWVFGPTDNPRVVLGSPTMGFEAAVIAMPEQPEVAVAPAPEQPGVVTTPTEPGVTTAPEQPEVAEQPATPEEPTTAVAGFRAMPAPFAQGQVIRYTPATADMPAMVTVQFDWQGTPLFGTFQVSDQEQWLSGGQVVDFSQIQPGTMVMVPESARLTSLTFNGPAGIGTIVSTDRTRNQVTVRLPTGELRTLRVSPQTIFLQNGQPMTIADLEAGQTVLFEVVPQGNSVGLFTLLPAGTRGTITQVTPNSITVQFMQNGQMVTQTFPLTEQTRFYFRGRQVSQANLSTTFAVGQPVYFYGPTDRPLIVAGGVQTGFEAAVVTPAPTAAVAGARERPQPARRRVIRGRW